MSETSAENTEATTPVESTPEVNEVKKAGRKKVVPETPLFGDYKPIEPEPKEKKADAPKDPHYDPLTTEPVAEKAYAKPFSTGPAETKDIPEPTFTPPNLAEPTIGTAPGQSQPRPPLKDTPLNPAMKEGTKKEQNRSASQLASAMLSGYDLLHRGARWFVQISDDKLQDMYLAGEISPDFGIPLNESGSRIITFKEYVQSFNQQTAEALVVSDEFKEKVHPVLTRVLEKYGMGLTDEQDLAIIVGEDVMIKAGLLVAFKKSMNKNLGIFCTFYKQLLTEKGGRKPGGEQPPTGETRPHQPAPGQGPTQDVNYEEVHEREEK